MLCNLCGHDCPPEGPGAAIEHEMGKMLCPVCYGKTRDDEIELLTKQIEGYREALSRIVSVTCPLGYDSGDAQSHKIASEALENNGLKNDDQQ